MKASIPVKSLKKNKSFNDKDKICVGSIRFDISKGVRLVDKLVKCDKPFKEAIS